MDIKDLENNIAQDLAVELADEFDENFERKAFFTDKWPSTKLSNQRGSLMMRSGNLRRSIRYNVRNNQILFSSSLPYASIHNEGGEIVVTQKMKKFFWAMFYKANGGKPKKGQKLTEESKQWQSMALMKVGHIIKIEKRQIVGDHPALDPIVKDVIDENMIEFNNAIAQKFK